MGMHKGVSLALKAKVVEHEEEKVCEEDVTTWDPKDVQDTHRYYMALASRTFWKNPAKAKEQIYQSSGKKEGGPRVRSCYNCQNQFHFVAECPFENREDHGGKLVPKDKSKIPRKKPFFKKNTSNKKPSRIVLLTQEEYSSDEEEETTTEVAAIAITSSPSSSLFESPNENVTNKSERCLMEKASEVSSTLTSISKTMNEMNDITSLKAKEEIVALDYFMANLQGESKKNFETLMSQYGEAQILLEEKGRIEREDALEIASFSVTLEEEQELRVSLEEKLESIEESHNLIISKLIKERDHAIAKCKS